MSHDPLCPTDESLYVEQQAACQCRLIARVREDEQRGMELTHAAIHRAAALRDAVQAVRGIDSCPECSVDEAVAAIEALGGQR